MKRDLLAQLLRAFETQTKQDAQPATVDNELCRNQPASPCPDREAEIIRQAFADYEDEEKFEIPWQ